MNQVNTALRHAAIGMLAFLYSAVMLHAAPLLINGERMVFLGDSITQQRMYTRDVMNYFALRYPGANISFRNAGVSGDTAQGSLQRLSRDVLSLKPDVVSICLGMNDGHYKPVDQEAYNTYYDNMAGLVDGLQKAGVKVVLLTTSGVDDERQPPWLQNPFSTIHYNDTLRNFGDGVKKLAAEKKVPVFDLQALMLDVLARAKADSPGFTMMPDAVHPTEAGHAVMAYALLKALGCTDQPSGLEIDMRKAQAITDRCKVDGLKVGREKVEFTRTDDALPMWFAPEVSAIYKYCPLIDELNNYKFKLTGSAPGKWKITVDGIDVGTFSSDELSAGVNLATHTGPWQNVGKAVNDLSTQQENLYFSRWRSVGLADQPKEAAQEFKALLDKLDLIISAKEADRIKEAAIGRTHKWLLEFVID